MLNKASISFQNRVIVEKEEWFWSQEHGVLCHCPLGCCEVSIAYNYTGKGNFGVVASYGSKIVVAPIKAECFLVYDRTTSEMRHIPMEGVQWGDAANIKGKIFDVQQKGKYAYFIGRFEAYVIKFDMEKETVEKSVKLFDKDSQFVLFSKVLLDGDVLFVPSFRESAVFRVNIDDLNYKKIKIETNAGGFFCICKACGFYWLLSTFYKEMYKWNGRDRQTDTVMLDGKEKPFESSARFRVAASDGQNIWLLPQDKDHVLCLDALNGGVSQVSVFEEYLKLRNIGNCIPVFSYAEYSDGILCAYYNSGKEFLHYNPETDELSTHKYIYDEEDEVKLCRKISKRGILLTDYVISLEGYLSNLCGFREGGAAD